VQQYFKKHDTAIAATLLIPPPFLEIEQLEKQGAKEVWRDGLRILLDDAMQKLSNTKLL
jgi:hypothetical protein